MRAWCLIRRQPHYRSEAFIAGLEAVGCRVSRDTPTNPRPGDVLCIWNRYGANEMWAEQVERAGGTAIICENGYMGADAEGRQFYALSVGQHNGAGWTPEGDDSRLHMLGAEPQPWRTEGSHILVRGQRGIGSKLMASPQGWHPIMAAEVRRRTKRPIVIREHPALAPHQPPLAAQLAGAWALVTWSSSDAGRALMAGVPAFFAAPHIICEATCRRARDDLEQPFLGDRGPALRRLSWGQWSVDEIAAGVPFRLLLQANARAA